MLYTGDRHLAEELAQETCVRLCRDWEKVSSLASPGAWAHRVALNLAHSSHRRRRAEGRATERVAGRADLRGPVDAGPDPGVAADVRAAVLALPETDRAVVVLRYFADLSVSETATALDLPVGTVKTRTRHAIDALRTSGLITEVLIDE